MNRGGAETLIMNLYRNIDRTRVQFDFLTSKKGDYDGEIKKLGGRIYRVPYVSEVGHTKYLRSLNDFFQSKNFQIIHSHMDKMSGIILDCAKNAGVPIRISHSHSTRSEGNLAVRIYKWYASLKINKSATHLFTCSRQSADWLYGQNANNAILLNNGIDPLTFRYSYKKRAQARKILEVKNDCKVFGHVGRFNTLKNHNYLIKLFKRINDMYPNSILVLIGVGPLQVGIKKLVKEMNLTEKVKFMNVREDIHLMLQGMDYFVFPSLFEGLPVTLIEAQAAGLPCLISDQITEEVDLGLGLLNRLPLNETDEWIRKLIELEGIEKSISSRLIDHERFVEKGYDIKVTAQKAQHTYLSLGM